jgi:hypothetical protein
MDGWRLKHRMDRARLGLVDVSSSDVTDALASVYRNGWQDSGSPEDIPR